MKCDCGKLLIDLEWRTLPQAGEERSECSCGQIHYRDAYNRLENQYNPYTDL